MTATATYGTTGDPYLDAVLSGVKWGVTSLTYSFPDAASLYGASYAGGENLTGFSAFNGQQIAAIRDILKMYATYANVTFSEVTETATIHGELRYAESASPKTAWAYYPSTAAAGGDAWFNSTYGFYDAPARGNYAWLTMLHETGHALGLKHPHEVRGSFAAMPVDHDSLEYTVMSYRSYIGASVTNGYTNGTTSYPQTLMMYDIAAIQKLYGANFGTNAGDTVYSWNPSTGTMSLDGLAQAAPAGNKVFMTIWDGGGEDTYSFAAYATGVKVDLGPGAWSTTSSTQLASLGVGKVAVGNIANALLYNGNTASLIENAIGGSGNDTISGNAADNKLTGGAGNDVLDGHQGNDTAVYSGLASNYALVHNADDSWTISDLRVTRLDGVDTLSNIEYLRFSDQTLQIAALTSPPPLPGDPPSPPPANLSPVALADAYSTTKGTKLTVTASDGVLRNDSDPEGQPLKAVLVSGPGKGSLSFKADGSFVYTPAKNFAGTATFKYSVSDGTNTSTATTVTIAVGASAVKQPPKGHAGINDQHQVPAPGSLVDSWNFLGAHKLDSEWKSPLRSFHWGALGDAGSMLDELTQVLSHLHAFGEHTMSNWSTFPGHDFLL